MKKDNLTLKNREFVAFKGKIKEIKEKDKQIRADLDLNETFENPSEEQVEKIISFSEGTSFFKVKLKFKDDGEMDEGEKEEISFEDLIKEDNILMVPSNQEDAFKILSIDKIKAQELIVFA